MQQHKLPTNSPMSQAEDRQSAGDRMREVIQTECRPEDDRQAAIHEALSALSTPFLYARYCDDGGVNLTEKAYTATDCRRLVTAVCMFAAHRLTAVEGTDEAASFFTQLHGGLLGLLDGGARS